MSKSLKINPFTYEFSTQPGRRLNRNDIKKTTKELCRVYKEGMIPEDTFHEIIEHLFVSFIEHSFDEKITSKEFNLDQKLYNFDVFSEW
jgi:hypothetical protein